MKMKPEKYNFYTLWVVIIKTSRNHIARYITILFKNKGGKSPYFLSGLIATNSCKESIAL